MNLTAEDLQMFERLGINQALLDKAGIARVDDATARRDCKLVGPGDLSGIAFPYFMPGGDREVLVWCRVRRDHPEVGPDGKPERKYLAPPSGENIKPIPYFPLGAQELIADATVPVLLVESEKATLALTAWSERTGHKILPLGLGGAWGWSTTIGTKEVKGQTVEIHGLHADLVSVCRNRKTYILLDANAATNADVQKARHRLTAELRNIGAEVHVLDLPSVAGVNGPDDYIAACGDQAMLDLFDEQRTGAAILAAVEAFLRRYIIMSDAQFAGVALWICHTHAIDAANFTPYLNISSPEKRSEKSRLLEVLFYLVRNPWNTSGVSGPTLFRGIDAKDRPCILYDEVDATFRGNPETTEAIRGLLNTGNKKGGTISRCVGEQHGVKDFNTFCPKAIAGIGNALPDTVRDRSLPIALKRKLGSEKVERLRDRLVKPEADPLRERLRNWVEGQLPQLQDARPQMPEALNDRQMEGGEILLAIADAIDGEWPVRARKALVELFQSENPADDSNRLRLLSDLRDIFTSFPLAEAFTTPELLEKLKAIETSPWNDWSRGRGLSAKGLSELLKGYGVGPEQFREKGDKIRGYRRATLQDAWDRYLAPPIPPPVLGTRYNASVYAGPEENQPGTDNPGVPGSNYDLTASLQGLPRVPSTVPVLEGSASENAKSNGTPIMPDTSTMLPFLAAQQIEVTDDRQIFYGEPPDLRPGRAGDTGLADAEDAKRRARYRRKNQ